MSSAVSSPGMSSGAADPYVMVRLGDQIRLGLVQSEVREALDLAQHPVNGVPGAPDFMQGVLHWRGQFLWVLDLGALMQSLDPQFSQPRGPWREGLVVQPPHAHPLVLLIREREGIIRLFPQELRAVQPSFRHAALFPAWIPQVEGRRVVVNLTALMQMIRRGAARRS